MSIATLTIDVNARMASIEKDMGRVAHIAEQQAARMEAAFAKLGPAIAGIFAGVSLGAVASSFRGLVDQLDALNDSADATGSSIENISGLEDVAKRTGGSLEDVTSILVKFNGVLKEADGKNGVSQALKAIGLDANELRKIDPAEALQKTAEALAGFADDGNKARLVQELFGKSVKEAAPFLKDLAEQGKLNVKVTSDQAAQAEKFNKQLFALSANLSGVARSMTAEALPAINKYLESLQNVNQNLDIMGARTSLVTYTALIKKTVSEIEEAQARLAKDPSNVEQKGKVDQLRDSYMKLQRAASQASDVLKGKLATPQTSGADIGPPRPLPSLPDLGGKGQKDKPESKVSEIDREIEALQRKLQTARNLTEVERVLDDVERGRLKGVGVPQIGQALDLAEQIDQANKLNAEFKAMVDRLNKISDAKARDKAEADRYFEASLTEAEHLEKTLARINELYNKGAFGAVGSADAIEKQARAINAAKSETDQLNASARELADIFTRAAERGADLGSALETIIKKKLLFDPMAKSLELGFQSLFNFAAGMFSSGAPSPASSLYSLFSGSGTEMGLKLPGHKDGLSYVPRDDYVARLHKGERVLTAKENAAYSSGGGISVVNYNTIGSNVSRADVVAAMEQARQSTLASISESRRNGGMYS